MVCIVGIQLAEGALSQLVDLSVLGRFFVPPPHIASPFNGEAELQPKEFLGFETAGSWWLVGLWPVLLAINILGEEIIWRGYLLPRQQKSFGRYAWVINDLLWCFVLHFFTPVLSIASTGELGCAVPCAETWKHLAWCHRAWVRQLARFYSSRASGNVELMVPEWAATTFTVILADLQLEAIFMEYCAMAAQLSFLTINTYTKRIGVGI